MGMIKKNFPSFEWLVGGLITVVALVAWHQSLDSSLDGVGVYGVFPLLGILAFSYMWSHYSLWALHLITGGTRSKTYREWSGLAVLVLILLHPSLIILQLNKDGFGLPPESFELYVGPEMLWAVIIAQLALVAFLAFEFHNKFSGKSWWKYVEIANAIAMVLIYIHAKQIGGVVNSAWYQYVWFAYGLTLIVSISYIIYRGKLLSQKKPIKQ